MGVDILCQAVSGMGKTAVFVLSSLHCVGESPQPASVLVLAHARELAYQIKGEFTRLAKFITDIRTEVILGGESLEKQKKLLKGPKTPHIIVGTPGRILHLAKDKSLNLDNLKMFILDECDKVLDNVGKCAIHISSFECITKQTFLHNLCVQTCVATSSRSSRRRLTASR